MKKPRLFTAVFICIVSLAVMTYVEKYLQPGYLFKSIIKIVMFAGGILGYASIYRQDVKSLIGLKGNRPSKKLLLSVLFAYAGIIVLYLLLQDHIDLAGIREKLLAKEHLSRDNFVFIFSYIIIVNSFLEESFFRGFIYNVFKDEGHEMAGMIFGSLAFALYHVSILDSWFQPVLMMLCIVGLCVVGLFLQHVCISQDDLKGSWLVHASANLAINTIGTIMLFK